MVKVHDMGGRPNDDPIDQGEHVLMDWERRIDSIRGVLGDKGYLGVDELRRAIEALPSGALRVPQLLRALDRGGGGPADREGRRNRRRAGGNNDSSGKRGKLSVSATEQIAFNNGDVVTVRTGNPPTHYRTPALRAGQNRNSGRPLRRLSRPGITGPRWRRQAPQASLPRGVPPERFVGQLQRALPPTACRWIFTSNGWSAQPDRRPRYERQPRQRNRPRRPHTSGHGHRGTELARPPRTRYGDSAGRERCADAGGSAAQRGLRGVSLSCRRRPSGGAGLDRPGVQGQAAVRSRVSAGRDGLHAARPYAQARELWRTRTKCITSWCAPSVPAIPARCWVAHQTGTRASPTARVQLSIPAAC